MTAIGYSSGESDANSPICFLLINASLELASIAVESCLRATTSEVYLGCMGTEEVKSLAQNSRVKLIDLSTEAQGLGIAPGKYVDFSQKEFFALVQLKWSLLSKVLLESNAPFVQYSDLDVLWISNPTYAISATFKQNFAANVLIQDFTTDPSSPNLCMGFSAFRNGKKTLELIESLKSLHQESLLRNPFLGDDDVITDYFKRSGSQEILRLPQVTFPTGNLGLLFSKKTFFPGINVPVPYIFHANFVVGNQRKIEYLLDVASAYRISFKGIGKARKLYFAVTLICRRIYHELKFK